MSLRTSPRKREDDAVARAGDLEIGLRLARVVHRHQVLAPVLDPLHRPVDMARGERDQEVFRIELAARAVAAADVVLDHLDGVFRQIDLLRQDAAVEERHLGGAGHREPALGSVPLGHDAARLHGEAIVAPGAHGFAPCVGRIAKRRVGVALAGLEDQRPVGPGRFEQQARPLRGAGAVGDRRQRLDLHLDGLERVLAARHAVGQHDRDRLADVAHLVVRDHRLLVGFELRQRLQPHRDDRRAARHVGGGDHRMDAGPAQRRRDVERDDAAVRHRTAQDHRMQQSREDEIVDILTAAAQEAQILAALHRHPDVGVPHRLPASL